MDLNSLALEDCMCSICMCIFVEPVTMPCTHTLCMPCFKQNVEATSLTCPLCRKRISTWARKAARDKTMINHALWQRIQSLFPDKVEKRLDGQDQEDESAMDVFQPIINIAQPGEIRQEYEEQLKRLEKERELEKQKEQEASEALIRRLERENQVKSVGQQLIEEKDEELARELENIVNEAGTDSPFNLLLKESRNRLTTRSRGSSTTNSSKQSPLTIESFIQKMRDAEKLKEADRSASNTGTNSPYPYTCYTPSDKDKFSRPSTVSVSSTSLKSSTSCTSYNTDADVEWEVVTNNENVLGEAAKSEEEDDGETSAAASAMRSSSTHSLDSINQELNHFKPIKSCPITPPKRNASGKVVETHVIRTTPRNLSRSDSFSPSASKSLSDIDAGSPVMRRRLSELEEERKSQVKQNSKGTETQCNNEEKKNDISKYFMKRSKCSSQTENIPTLYTANTNPIVLKKAIIPLEPIFHNANDIQDFEDVMVPLMEIDNNQKRPVMKDKPIKVRHRNLSVKEDLSNNSVSSPQRSIKDWLSGTNSAIKNAYCNMNAYSLVNRNDNCSMDSDIDSKEGILNSCQATQSGSNKLRLKKYPKRKHAAYHSSDYVYPHLSPKKRKICIELSSDEETSLGGRESDGESVECMPLFPVAQKPISLGKTKGHSESGKQRQHAKKLQEAAVKKLKSVKQTKHQDKRAKTMHTFLQPKAKISRTKKSSQCVYDNDFNNSVMSEKDKQEETDRQLALELERLFKYEVKNKLNAIRVKGSGNEYNFRRKSSRIDSEEHVIV